MSVFLSLLGVTMMVTGLAAIYSGSLFVGIERGWTMVVSGTVAFSAGAILLGLSAAVRRLRRIERATKQLTGALTRRSAIETVVEADPAGAAPSDSPSHAAPVQPEKKPEQAPDGAAGPEKIVGTYQAGGNSYVMYGDGSIRADTPSGEHRFASMDEFKAYMLTGTLRARPPEEPGKIAPPSDPVQASDNPTAFSAKA